VNICDSLYIFQNLLVADKFTHSDSFTAAWYPRSAGFLNSVSISQLQTQSGEGRKTLLCLSKVNKV